MDRTKNYPRIGNGKHGGGNARGCFGGQQLEFGPEEINTLLRRVRDVNWLTDNLMNIKTALEEALRKTETEKSLAEEIVADAKEGLSKLLEYIVDCESRVNLLERNITSAIELDSKAVVTSDALARRFNEIANEYMRHDTATDWYESAMENVNSLQRSLQELSANAIKNTEKGAPGGVATLNANGKVSTTQLPAHLEDIIDCYLYMGSLYRPLVNGRLKTEDVTNADFTQESLVTPSKNVLYNNVTNNSLLRWTGSVYQEISPSPGSTDEVVEGEQNLYFTPERAAQAMFSHTGNDSIHVTSREKSLWNRMYIKPGFGIPEEDLSEAVKGKLNAMNLYAGKGYTIPGQSASLSTGAMYLLRTPGDSSIKTIPIWWTGAEWVDAYGNTYQQGGDDSHQDEPDGNDYYYYSGVGSDDYYGSDGVGSDEYNEG